jgi:hypothetical protein
MSEMSEPRNGGYGFNSMVVHTTPTMPDARLSGLEFLA